MLRKPKNVLSALLMGALTIATAAGCASDSSTSETPRAKGQKRVEPTASTARSGIEKDNFDPAVRAADDFFRHTNGKWLERTEIPADRSNYGSFTELVDNAEANLKVIIDEAAGMNAEAGTTAQRVGDAYKSFMDVEKVDALGFTPMQATLARIDGLKTHEDVAKALGELSGLGVKTPYGYWIDQDAKDPNSYILYFQQSGLSLPDRDYYLVESETNTAARAAMVDYVKTIFAAVGASPEKSAEAAKLVVALETEIAKAQWPRAETRDREKAYNKVTAADAPKAFTGFPVAKYFEGFGVNMAQDFIVRQPTYVSAMGDLFKKTPVGTWQAYLNLRALDHFAPYLASGFVDAHFNFHSKALAGVKENRPREKRGVALVEKTLGEDVGRLYVERHFTPEAKARMAQLVKNLIVAFESRIETRPWMTAETKKAAKEKLSKFTTKIGYPNKWKDYGTLQVKSDDLMGNVIRSATLEHRREMSKLGKPVDREEWFMTPQTVNAYYNSNMNEIVFPAAILQPPFFDMEADDAVNYGAIGAVIGHELSHGFDDQGAKSDGDGNLRNWWQPEDEEKFKAKGAALISQYDAYAPFPDANVQGKLTLGENIGDLGGITVAHAAYMLSLGGKPAPVIDDMTGPQRFFYGWGQIWRRKYREAELRRRLLTDPHSPSEYRVIGVLANVPAFYEAFGVKDGDKMFLPAADRVEIW